MNGRILRTLVVSTAVAVLSLVAAAAEEWTNLTPENRLGGRMVSPGYLRGKVVLLDCRNYGSKAEFEEIRELQAVWSAYKTKPFVVVGSSNGSDSPRRMAAILERLGVTYPVYVGAACGKAVPRGNTPTLYIIDSTGQCRWAGSNAREAKGKLGDIILNAKMPAGAKQLKVILDYEIENLPGSAFLRLRDLSGSRLRAEVQEKFPDDYVRYQAAYRKLKGDAEIVRLSKLVDLSAQVKDRDPDAKGSRKITKAGLEKVIRQYESLKESSNPFVVQEAKNAIADLMFVAATLAK